MDANLESSALSDQTQVLSRIFRQRAESPAECCWFVLASPFDYRSKTTPGQMAYTNKGYAQVPIVDKVAPASFLPLSFRTAPFFSFSSDVALDPLCRYLYNGGIELPYRYLLPLPLS